MQIKIQHEIKKRIRFSIEDKRKLSFREADIMQYYLLSLDGVTSAKVYERTGDVAFSHRGDKGVRDDIMEKLNDFSFDDEDVLALVPENTSRELMVTYKEKLIKKIMVRYACKWFLPYPLGVAKITLESIKFLKEGISLLWKRKLEVPVLDATAIGVSLARRDFTTASSIMFLLGIGEILEEWTHKKSVADLAQSMSLNIEKVWLKTEDGEILTDIRDVKEDDLIAVHMGNMIALDGIVDSGEAMVNQASLTGEGIPVKKEHGAYVYAGTVVEEGELLIKVKQAAGATRYEKIVSMIEDSEKLKSSLESKAEHLADRLVPLTFLGTLGVYGITRNITKTLTVLLVDFSCALKLSMPIAVLSAMKEAQDHSITVKGGKFLEAIAEAETVVFDKTGTFTKAQPKVAEIITFGDRERREMLRMAACLEEHFPHSVANAVVNQALEEGITHEELHSKVEYVVAHGISSEVEGKKVIIGSHHFIFEDENTQVNPLEQEKLDNLPEEYSHLYLSIAGELAAVICIEDPLREEAVGIVSALKEAGIKNVVMMTGDSERTAKAIAEKVGVDKYYAEVLPEDKARFVEAEKASGRKVIMVGDGINDSPALSAADAGIAISDGAQIAREISDVTISGRDLFEVVTLKRISNQLVKRISANYRFVMGFNLGLIGLGLAGVLQPGTSALLHNASTLGVGLHSMTPLLEKKSTMEAIEVDFEDIDEITENLQQAEV